MSRSIDEVRNNRYDIWNKLDGKKLELGGGLKKISPEFIGIDVVKSKYENDIVCNLEKEYIPLPSNSIKYIYACHFFEHIENLIPVINECYRILETDGVLEFIVPHMKSTIAWQDPTHKRFFNSRSVVYFCGEYIKKYNLDYGIACCFKELSCDIIELNPEIDIDGTPHDVIIKFVLCKDLQHLKYVKYDIVDNNIINWENVFKISEGDKIENSINRTK